MGEKRIGSMGKNFKRKRLSEGREGKPPGPERHRRTRFRCGLKGRSSKRVNVGYLSRRSWGGKAPENPRGGGNASGQKSVNEESQVPKERNRDE